MSYRDDLAANAANAALALLGDIETDLKFARRQYEDYCERGDVGEAAQALRAILSMEQQRSALVSAVAPQGGMTEAEGRWLQARPEIANDPRRLAEVKKVAGQVLASGVARDSAEYFSAIEHAVGAHTNSPNAPLTPNEAAKICGVDPNTYNRNVDRLEAMKRSGHYRD